MEVKHTSVSVRMRLTFGSELLKRIPRDYRLMVSFEETLQDHLYMGDTKFLIPNGTGVAEVWP